eukprot:14404711-Heterocapsa_arctica.AAC.1
MWIEQHRSSGKSLGRIMQETYERREAQWDLPQAAIYLASSGKGKRGGGDAANSGIDKKGG